MTGVTRQDRPGARKRLGVGDRIGSYVLTGREIGSGGFGHVYEAEQPELALRVAIKVQDCHWDPRANARALREAKALARIQHRNVVRIFDAGELAHNQQYLAMEFLSGETLRDILARDGALSPRRALAILGALGDALDAIHARGIIHRDLKPSNVFLCRDDDGEVYPKLIDFGIAKDLGGTDDAELTNTGTLVGTPTYMSPEQCLGLRTVDHRSDIYSLGLLAYHMLAGRPPFDGVAIDVAHRHLHATVPMVTVLRRELPHAVNDVFVRLLAKRPEDRVASAGDAVELLARALESPLPEEPSIEIVPAPPHTARRLRVIGLGVLLAGLGVCALWLTGAFSSGSSVGDNHDGRQFITRPTEPEHGVSPTPRPAAAPPDAAASSRRGEASEEVPHRVPSASKPPAKSDPHSSSNGDINGTEPL